MPVDGAVGLQEREQLVRRLIGHSFRRFTPLPQGEATEAVVSKLGKQ